MNRRSVLGLCVALSGCAGPLRPGRETPASRTSPGAGSDGPDTDGGSSPDDGTGRAGATPVPVPDGPYGFTYGRASGNRYVEGRGRLPDVDPVTVDLPGTPAWVVGVPAGDGGGGGSDSTDTDDRSAGTGTLWAVVLADGRVQGVRIADGTARRVAVESDGDPGPPALASDGERPRLLTAPGGSALTHPVPAGEGLVAIRRDGTVALHRGSGPATTLGVDALPDARPVVADGRAFVLAGATRAYGHGVLGDGVEAGTVAVVDPAGGRVRRRLDPPDGTVIEGIAPIVADVDGDGTREVLVTASDADVGARLVALRPDGGAPVTGPPVGSGFRWRHQLAVAPFGPDGEPEAAAVRTPHIGGVAEFYRAREGALELAATLRGYSSHGIGSRNLDMAAAGDFDGDGRVELLVPDDPRRSLAGLRRVDGGVEEAWRLDLDAGLETNVATVGAGGRLSVAVGAAGTLRVWPG